MAQTPAGVYPVNEAGEVVLQSGSGTTNVVGYINSSQVPTDNITNKMVVKVPKLFYGSNVAILGDSIAQQNTNAIGTPYPSNNYLQRGPVAWALCYLGWPWETQPTDNFAVFGSTMDIILANQVPVLLEAHKTRKYTRVFISSGTNDTNSGLFTLDQVKANFLAIFKILRDNNIIPVHTGIRPRGQDTSGTYPSASPAKLQNVAINEWLYQQHLLGLVEYIPVSEIYADNSTAYGNVLSTLVYDSVLHPNGRGASLEGQAIANYYTSIGVQPQLKFATQQNDVFDRTNNITGVAYNLANPLLQGSVSAGALGVAPTGMTVSGTGSTWSKVSRTLPNGQSRSDASCALAPLTLHYLYDDWLEVSGQPWAATKIQPGDVLEARAKVVITSGVNIGNVSLLASITDGAAGVAHTCLFTDSSSIPDGTYTLYLKTPRFIVPPYSGSGQQSIFTRAVCSTLATASGTFTVQAMEVRKVG